MLTHEIYKIKQHKMEICPQPSVAERLLRTLYDVHPLNVNLNEKNINRRVSGL